MASVETRDRQRLNSCKESLADKFHRTVADDVKRRPRTMSTGNTPRLQNEDKSTPIVSQGQASVSNRRGSKRRVSESTPGWNPVNKKRPRSEGDCTARSLRFSPYATVSQCVQKPHERSLEMVCRGHN